MKTKIAILNQENKQKLTSLLSRLGSSLMLPISLVAFSSIILGISFTLPSDIFITTFLNKISLIIFVTLPFMVYISIIIHFHLKRKTNSLINAIIFLFVYIAIQSSIAEWSAIPLTYITNLGTYDHYSVNPEASELNTIGLSIFGMLILGYVFIKIDSWTENNFYLYLMFIFFTLILTPLFMLIYLLLMSIGWLISIFPYGINAFVYGFVNRLLVPIGLHSILMPTFLYSSVGGVLTLTSESDVITITGDSQIWVYMYTHGMDFTVSSGNVLVDGIQYSYQLTNTNDIGQYQQGFIPMITFVYPMVAIAYTIKYGWEKGNKFIFVTLITMATGVTEITEFSFIFINPYLYFVNAIITGLSFMILNILNVSVWISTGWSLDLILFGIIPSIKGFQTNWYFIPMVGLVLGFLYSTLYIILDTKSSNI